MSARCALHAIHTGNNDVTIFDENITFPITTMSGDVMCFDVLAIDDDILEGEQSVEIFIISEDVSVDPSSLTLNIQDNNDLDGTLPLCGVLVGSSSVCSID